MIYSNCNEMKGLDGNLNHTYNIPCEIKNVENKESGAFKNPQNDNTF